MDSTSDSCAFEDIPVESMMRTTSLTLRQTIDVLQFVDGPHINTLLDKLHMHAEALEEFALDWKMWLEDSAADTLSDIPENPCMGLCASASVVEDDEPSAIPDKPPKLRRL